MFIFVLHLHNSVSWNENVKQAIRRNLRTIHDCKRARNETGGVFFFCQFEADCYFSLELFTV